MQIQLCDLNIFLLTKQKKCFKNLSVAVLATGIFSFNSYNVIDITNVIKRVHNTKKKCNTD
jgi:hypothetical protein